MSVIERPASSPPPELVCLGASAGGVEALLELLAPLPADFRLPIVIVLHLPEDRDSVLAEVFQHHMGRPVREARDKERIEPGVVYFAPAGYHLLVERDASFALSCDAPVNHSRPAIDLMFSSASQAFGPALCAVLLTGANFDGAEGLAEAARAGGITLVQDPRTARVATMPEAALRLFPLHTVLSLKDIRESLIQLDQRHA